MSSRLMTRFPWIKAPAIINGPMSGAVASRLAAEVTKAGGLGFLGATVDLNSGSQDLANLNTNLQEARELLGGSDKGVNVGAAFVTGHESVTKFKETAVPILAKHQPAAVWLFAPDADVSPHSSIIEALKGLSSPPAVFVQVGNVAAAREAVQDGADVLVCQGIDAGGHQFRQGTSIVPLVPEVKDMLRDEFPGKDIIVVAAGGIVDGRGAAAALTLGADGIVMGTRFTVATESIYPDFRKESVINTSDGGKTTLKSPFCDQINNIKLWGPLYDGRAIISPVHEKFLAGASLDECKQFVGETYSEEEATRLHRTWAGAGVGLVKKAQPAGEIVREVRQEARDIIKKASELFNQTRL